MESSAIFDFYAPSVTFRLTHQRVLRDWLLIVLGELGGSARTATALAEMERRYGSLLLEGDWEKTIRDQEPKWQNRTRYERKNMERAGLLIPASVSRGVWTLTEAGEQEYRRLREAGAPLGRNEESAKTDSLSSVILRQPEGKLTSTRIRTTVQRIVRSTVVSDYVKQVHDYTCQICRIRLAAPTGAYAEAAHIQALGKPHNGLDIPSNVLCLCPNHNVLFDLGMLIVADDLAIVNLADDTVLGHLREVAEHQIDRKFLAYHRTYHARPKAYGKGAPTQS